jgi:hypothetical protein
MEVGDAQHGCRTSITLSCNDKLGKQKRKAKPQNRPTRANRRRWWDEEEKMSLGEMLS